MIDVIVKKRKTDKPIYRLDDGFAHLSIFEREKCYYEIPFEEAKNIIDSLYGVPMILHEVVFDGYYAIPIGEEPDDFIDSVIAFPTECIATVPLSK